MSDLTRTKYALDVVKEHLARAGQSEPVIENFLVQYLSVAFYSEMEERVKRIYQDRLHFDGDARLKFFVERTQDKMLQRVRKSEIKDLAKCFGDDCRELFDGQVSQKDAAIYSSVIENRHGSAHGSGGNITLSEFEKAIDAAAAILDSLENAIR